MLYLFWYSTFKVLFINALYNYLRQGTDIEEVFAPVLQLYTPAKDEAKVILEPLHKLELPEIETLAPELIILKVETVLQPKLDVTVTV